jgi:hypothetical protein
MVRYYCTYPDGRLTSLSSPFMLVTASSQSSTAETSGMATTGPAPPPEDPSCPIKGMYRLLDLITEQGSSGLGNRFIVAGYTTLTIFHSG